jgi:hypothetical protein
MSHHLAGWNHVATPHRPADSETCWRCSLFTVSSKKMGPMICCLEIAHQTPTFSGCSGSLWYTCGFSAAHTHVFYEFTYPDRWNHASFVNHTKSIPGCSLRNA